MKTIVLKVRNLPNSVDTDLFVYCMQQDVAVSYPRGKVELVPDMGEKRDVCKIVRCKDCKCWKEHHKWVRPEGGSYIAPRCNHLMKKTCSDWFCADGERR